MTRHVIYLSIPGLRASDVRADRAPTLTRWAENGALAEFEPTFPCVTSPVQASTWTGVGPRAHGVVANGFYDRRRAEVAFWVGRNGVIDGEQIWSVLARRGVTSAVWHAQNIKDAAADFIITPEPIHEPDGTTRLWCYSKPDGLYEQLVTTLGHFPLHHYWGPLSNIESSRWILSAARWLIERHKINFHYIYLPHLDYAAQKFGPDAPEAEAAVSALDTLLAEFDAFLATTPLADDAVILAVSEYAMTRVRAAVLPNVLLAEAGLLRTRRTDEGTVIDFRNSKAFAMVDHQFAHVYATDGATAAEAAELLAGADGVARAFLGSNREEIGLNHPRSGEVVLLADPERWFAYYWWRDQADAPAFARTVDIHRKPGFDPVELFIDPARRSIPLDPSLVRGSHGVPISMGGRRGGLVCNRPVDAVRGQAIYRDVDMKAMVLKLLDESVDG